MEKDALPREGKDTQLKDPRDFALGLSDQGLSLLSWAPRPPPCAVFSPRLPFFSTLITTCCDMPSAHKVLLPEPSNPAIMVWWEGHLTWEPGGVLPHPSPLGWLCLGALVALSVNMDIRGIAHEPGVPANSLFLKQLLEHWMLLFLAFLLGASDSL